VLTKIKNYHKICERELIFLFSKKSDEFFDNVYNSKKFQYRSKKDQPTSSSGNDIFAFISNQLTLVEQNTSPRSKNLFVGVSRAIFTSLKSIHSHHRDSFFLSYQSVVMAANDFVSMSEIYDEIKGSFHEKKENTSENLPYVDQAIFTDGKIIDELHVVLDENIAEMLALYNSDAIYIAESLHKLIFESISEKIVTKLFTCEWEESTLSQEALFIIETIGGFWSDLAKDLDTRLLSKALNAIISATVNLYIKAFLMRATEHQSGKKPYWTNESRTLERMAMDIEILEDFFRQQNITSSTSHPSLEIRVEDEFQILHILHELLSVAFSTDKPKTKAFRSASKTSKNSKRASVNEASHLINSLQGRIQNEELTRRVVCDIWHLAAPKQAKKIMRHMRNNLNLRTGNHTQVESINSEKLHTRASSIGAFDVENSNQKPGYLLNLSIILFELYKDQRNTHDTTKVKKNKAIMKMRSALRSTPVPKQGSVFPVKG